MVRGMWKKRQSKNLSSKEIKVKAGSFLLSVSGNKGMAEVLREPMVQTVGEAGWAGQMCKAMRGS